MERKLDNKIVFIASTFYIISATSKNFFLLNNFVLEISKLLHYNKLNVIGNKKLNLNFFISFFSFISFFHLRKIKKFKQFWIKIKKLILNLILD